MAEMLAWGESLAEDVLQPAGRLLLGPAPKLPSGAEVVSDDLVDVGAGVDETEEDDQ